MKKFVLLTLIAVAVLFAIPKTIQYQGKLTDLSGVGENADLDMTFRIFDSEVDGIELWTESHDDPDDVPIVHGLFDVELGSITAIDLPFDEQYWLEIEIAGSALAPRLALNASPYAFRAAFADSVAGGTIDADWQIAGSDMYSLATGYVGIGTTTPSRFLHVEGEEMRNYYFGFAPGYFKNTVTDMEGAGIFAECANTDWYGVGGAFRGGFMGVRGMVQPTGGQDYRGVYGEAIGGTGQNYGIYGFADGLGVNYGVYGTATSGATNWAGYFDGDGFFSGNLITSDFQMTDGAFDGYILQSDVFGNASWVDPGMITPTGDGDWTINGVDMYSAVSGNVGIGTTTPTAKLDIQNATQPGVGNGNIEVYNHNNGNAIFAVSNNTGLSTYTTTYASAKIAFYDSVPDPSGVAELADVGLWGHYRGADGFLGYGLVATYGSNPVAPTRWAYLAGQNYAGYFSDDVKIDSSLYVHSSIGIGTENPYDALHVQAYDSTDGTDDGVFISVRNTCNDTLAISGVRFKNHSNDNNELYKAGIVFQRKVSFGRGDLLFLMNDQTNNTNAGISAAKMVLTHGGKVGIGTTAPAAKLDVGGGIADFIDGNNDVLIADDLEVDGTIYGDGSALTGIPANEHWVYNITDVADTTLITGGAWGISRAGNVLLGNADSTHVNLGLACTTGSGAGDYKYCTVGGGKGNAASRGYTTVGGGLENNASASGAAIGGGYSNEAGGDCSAIAGGADNIANDFYSTVAGGAMNSASEYAATVGGGTDNVVTGNWSTISGGQDNAITDYNSAIGGGKGNRVDGYASAIPGGYENSDSADYSLVFGRRNLVRATADYSVLFGLNDTIAEDSTFVIGLPYARIQSATYLENLPNDATGDSILTVDLGQVKKIATSDLTIEDVNWADSATFTMVRGQKGVFGYGDIGYGNHDSTHVNFGVNNETGSIGQNYKYCTVGGGAFNYARNANSTIGGGYGNMTNGENSTIGGGNGNTAGGDYTSIGGGIGNSAIGYRAMVGGGSNNSANGDYSAIGGGHLNTALGQYSAIPGGRIDTVSGYCSFAFGRHAVVNTDYTARFFSPDFPGSLLVSGDVHSNTMMIDDSLYFDGEWRKDWPSGTDGDWTISGSDMYSAVSGNVGIGTTSPECRLSLDNDGGIIAIGTFGSGDTVPISGAGTRLIWNPRKAAFRAGYVDGDQWNDYNISNYSFAVGANNKASNDASVALGWGTTADGFAATAMGCGSTASGSISTAMGHATTASGWRSTAMGEYTTASGDFSTSMGSYSTANGDYSFSFGHFVTADSNGSTVIGSGYDDVARLVNDIPNSIMIGLNCIYPYVEPSLFIGQSSFTEPGKVGIGISKPESFSSDFNDLVVGRLKGRNGITICADSVSRACIAFADGFSGTAEYSGLIYYDHAVDKMFLTTGGEGYASGTRVLAIDSLGNVGIGTITPTNKMQIEASGDTAIFAAGNSGTVGYFNNTSESAFNYAVSGICANSPDYGTGAYFEGGSVGLEAQSNLSGDGSRAGIHAEASGGNIWNTGVFGSGTGGGSAIGLFGQANDGTTCYGVYAVAAGGTTNWAGYFNGDAYFEGNVGIGNTFMSEFYSGADDLVVGSGTQNHGITIFSDDGYKGLLAFAKDTSETGAYNGLIYYDHSDDKMFITTAGEGYAEGDDAFTIDGSGRIGIRETSPIAQLHVLSTGTDAITAQRNGECHININAFGSSAYPIWASTRSRGTAASPSAVQSGDELLILNANGQYSSTSYRTGGQLEFEANENWTSSDNGTRIVFNGVPDGETSLSEWMRLADGRVGIGTATPGSGFNTDFDVVGRNSLRTNTYDTNKGLVIDYIGTAHRIYTDALSGTPYDLILGTYPNGHLNQLVLDQSNGNVGIGTTTPTRKLWVNGAAGGTTGWYNDSDVRLKNNVVTIDNALDKVENLRGVYFEWNDKENHILGRQMGFIAQEALPVIPEVVDKAGEYYGMDYASINALLVEAIKELKAQNDSLRARIEALENK